DESNLGRPQFGSYRSGSPCHLRARRRLGRKAIGGRARLGRSARAVAVGCQHAEIAAIAPQPASQAGLCARARRPRAGGRLMATIERDTRIEAGSSADIDAVMAVMEEAFGKRFGEAWTRSQLAGILPMGGVSLILAHSRSLERAIG